jgi:hypothetical protein
MLKQFNIVLICVVVLIFGCSSVTDKMSIADKEYKWAKIAWLYFENNYNEKTGLVNTSDGYSISSLWTIGDNIIATICAYELKLITEFDFDKRISNQLSFLNSAGLLNKNLFNKYYNTLTGDKVNISNKTSDEGWSGNDIARMLIALKILNSKYPQYREYSDKAVIRLNFSELVDSMGYFYSGIKSGKEFNKFIESNLGTKEYLARGYQAYGINTKASSYFLEYEKEKIYDVLIYSDGREFRKNQYFSNNYIVSLPFILDYIEFGWKDYSSTENIDYMEIDSNYSKQGKNISYLQEKRYKVDKILTARTNHRAQTPPFHLIDAVFANGFAWNTIDNNNKYYKNKSLVSVAASAGLWVILNDEYTETLINSLKYCFDPLSGWYEGRSENSGYYEKVITASTNATVLEAIYYKFFGNLYKNIDITDTYYYKYFNNSQLQKKSNIYRTIKK